MCRAAADETADRELALLLEAEAVSGELLRGVERSRPATLEATVGRAQSVGERALLVHVAGDLAARGTRPAGEVAEMCAVRSTVARSWHGWGRRVRCSRSR